LEISVLRARHHAEVSPLPYPYPRPVTGSVSRMPASAVKSFLLVLCVGVILVLGSAAPAAAASATPCWKAVINDWFDGRLDQTYPTQCYQQALQHLPRDVQLYSSAKDDIQSALYASMRQNRDVKPTYKDGSGPTASSSGTEGGPKSIIQNVIEWLGPSNAQSVPLPLLILAGVAFLLLAAAGGSFVSRRLQARRLPPPPQA